MQFGFLGLLPAFFFSSIVPSLNWDVVSANTLSPVEGGPIIEQPAREAIAAATAKLSLADIRFPLMLKSCRALYPGSRRTPRCPRAQASELVLELVHAIEQRDREREPAGLEIEVAAQP